VCSGDGQPCLGRAASEQRLGLAGFGLGLLSELTPPGAWQPRPLSEPLVRVRLAERQVIEQSWSGRAETGWEGTIDGCRFIVERGLAGDYRFVHGPAVHHLCADASVLRCAPADPSDPAWWRVVLDSVLFTTALLHGYEALHAAAVATPLGAVAIAAGTGGGKSTLLSELLLAELTLMADDILVLRPCDGEPPLAHPAPPVMTVPAHRTPLLRERGCAPRTIASIGEEDWLPVPVHPSPLPLRALVFLNRKPGLATEMRVADRPLAVLMESLLRFPRTRERERARFELAGTIAEHVPIWQLDADPRVTPAALADALLSTLQTPRRPSVGAA
jgi:hypothetical protein